MGVRKFFQSIDTDWKIYVESFSLGKMKNYRIIDRNKLDHCIFACRVTW